MDIVRNIPQGYPQGYPLLIAYADLCGMDDEPSTDEGRLSIADHAAMTDPGLRARIAVRHVIGWLLLDPHDEPIPLTPDGLIFAHDGTTYWRIVRFGENSESLILDVLEVLRNNRDRALRRCQGLNICPTGHVSPPSGLIEEFHRTHHR